MVAAGWAVPSFVAETARLVEAGSPFAATASAAGRRVLVIVQYAGGNDGVNTLIPYGDPTYYSPNVRPALQIPRPTATTTDPKVIPLTDYVRPTKG